MTSEIKSAVRRTITITGLTVLAVFGFTYYWAVGAHTGDEVLLAVAFALGGGIPGGLVIGVIYVVIRWAYTA